MITPINIPEDPPEAKEESPKQEERTPTMASVSSDFSKSAKELYWQSTKKRTRFIALMNMCMMLMFIIWDYSYYPNVLIPLLVVRCGVIVPIALIFVSATYHPSFWRVSQLAIFIGYSLTGIAMVAIRVICQETSPSESVLVVIILVFLSVGLQFFWAVAAALIILIAFIIGHTVLIPFHVPQLVSVLAVLITAFGMGAAGSYFDTVWARSLFDSQIVRSLTRFNTRVENLDEVMTDWRKGMKMKLEFPNVSIEKHFQQEFGRVTQNKRRIASLLSICMQAVLSLLDEMFQNHNTISIVMRYAVVCPFAIAAFTLTFTRHRRKLNLGTTMAVLVFISTNFAVSLSTGVFETNASLIEFNLIRFMLTLFFGFIFSPMSYFVASICGCVSCFAYIILMILVGKFGGVSTILFIVVALMVGAFTSYNQEKQVRSAFLASAPTRYAMTTVRSEY